MRSILGFAFSSFSFLFCLTTAFADVDTDLSRPNQLSPPSPPSHASAPAKEQKPIKKKASGEKQPWSDYTVHDPTRPRPLKVSSVICQTTPPPNDAQILFDGTHTKAWSQPWKIIDQIMVATKAGHNTSLKKFASCQLHLEWRIPAGRKINGQKGGNSGVFLMKLYEIQIQESHRNVTYADGQAGAIYGQYPPLVNASLPQGEWQSYDINFTAPVYEGDKCTVPARLTVYHNGVLIQNNRILHGPTQHRKVTSYPKQHPEKEAIMLQWHNDPIEFRNIWIRETVK